MLKLNISLYQSFSQIFIVADVSHLILGTDVLERLKHQTPSPARFSVFSIPPIHLLAHTLNSYDDTPNPRTSPAPVVRHDMMFFITPERPVSHPSSFIVASIRRSKFPRSTTKVGTLQANVKVITKYPNTGTRRKLERFIGMVNFYHRLFSNCAEITGSLTPPNWRTKRSNANVQRLKICLDNHKAADIDNSQIGFLLIRHRYEFNLWRLYTVDKSSIMPETKKLTKPYPQMCLFINMHMLKFICRAMRGQTYGSRRFFFFSRRGPTACKHNWSLIWTGVIKGGPTFWCSEYDSIGGYKYERLTFLICSVRFWRHLGPASSFCPLAVDAVYKRQYWCSASLVACI